MNTSVCRAGQQARTWSADLRSTSIHRSTVCWNVTGGWSASSIQAASFGSTTFQRLTTSSTAQRFLFFVNNRYKLLLRGFYSASALLARQTAVIARAILSVCLSVRPSHSGVLSRRMKIQSCCFRHHVSLGKSFNFFWEVKFVQIFAGDHPQRGR